MKDELIQWVNSICEQTKKIWEETGRDKRGYAIFYSPVKYHPRFMIIGYNPGGGDKDFLPDKCVQSEHDYKKSTYPLARNMRKIFEGTDLLDDLFESVKFNLIFFRSKNKKDLNYNDELIKFSLLKTTEIIKILNPEIIIAEGFGTFEEIINLYPNQCKEIHDSFYDKKRIMRRAKISINESKILVLGLIHPSSGWGLTDEIFNKLGRLIRQEVLLKEGFEQDNTICVFSNDENIIKEVQKFFV